MSCVLDIVLNFFTTFVNKKNGKVIHEKREIAVHYIKTWFILDLLAAIPFELLVVFKVNTVRLVPHVLCLVLREYRLYVWYCVCTDCISGTVECTIRISDKLVYPR